MKTSEKVAMISKAYAECSPKLLNIAKDSKGYGYTYTSLEKLIEHTKPILAEHGLAIMQMPTGNGLITRMLHNSGEWIEQEMTSELIQMKQMNAFQVQGSQITYLRRYMWASICGIASDDDMDAKGEEVKAPQPLPKINDAQFKLVNTLISKKGVDRSMVKSAYNVESLKDLDSIQTQKLIKQLESKEDV